MSAAPTTVPVALDRRAYDIHIGPGLIAEAGRWMRPVLKAPRAVVIADAAVAKLHLEALAAALDAASIAHDTITVPPGEASKSFHRLESLMSELLHRRIERSTTLVALGGGVIGDLVGFAAAIALRGIDFVQIPTTLLAQVDSSVGGKTAINTPEGKNLVGAFHQPRLVLADTDALKTLPRREMLAGYAEVAKYGVIGDAGFFAWLEANGARVVGGDAQALVHAVATSCRAKAKVVEADEREEGLRETLNFGHTFGHALEAETGFSDALLHGEAVGFGMVLAARLSVAQGLCPAGDCERLRAHLAGVGLPTRFADLPQNPWSAERLIEHMGRDKKVRDGRVRFVLTRGIGSAFTAADVPIAAAEAMLAGAIAGRTVNA
ncbi:MAG: 3-dehydroquinate synthase [Alphaproteobacteria bacterium]|nr:3-dehydroquinate synthase [Alphaproteobacteria bacterium]